MTIPSRTHVTKKNWSSKENRVVIDDANQLGMQCPKCNGAFTPPKNVGFHGKKGNCPGCGCRILLSDQLRCTDELRRAFGKQVGVLTNTSGEFKCRAVKLTNDLSGITGTKKPEPQELYSHCWLVPESSEQVHICFGAIAIAQLAKNDAIEFAKALRSLAETTILGSVCKLTSFPQPKGNDKWTVHVDIPFLQIPKLDPPPSIPVESIRTLVTGLRGATRDGNVMEGYRIDRATLEEVIEYLTSSGDEAYRLLALARQDPNGPRYYGKPKEILCNEMATWIDDDWKYEVTLRCRGSKFTIEEARNLSPYFHRCARTQVNGLRGELKFKVL